MEQPRHPIIKLPLWQRLLITTFGMLVASFIFGQIWQALFNVTIPSYIAGIVGGLIALPIWEGLKRIRVER